MWRPGPMIIASRMKALNWLTTPRWQLDTRSRLLLAAAYQKLNRFYMSRMSGEK